MRVVTYIKNYARLHKEAGRRVRGFAAAQSSIRISPLRHLFADIIG
jgi:hypothetical protein